LKKDIDNLERKNASAERENRELRNKFDDAKFKLDSEEKAKSKLLDTIRDLRRLLLERENSNSVLISQLHNNNDDERRVVEGELGALKEKNERLAERNEQLQDEFNNLFKKLESRAAGGEQGEVETKPTESTPKPADA